MKKQAVQKKVVWGILAGAVVLAALAVWYFVQPMERIRALTCERVMPGTVGTCARIIHTYNRTGLLEKYEVEFTPTNDGEFQGNSRALLHPIDTRCGIEFASANWTAEALVITTQSDPTVTCTIGRSVIGSWL